MVNQINQYNLVDYRRAKFSAGSAGFDESNPANTVKQMNATLGSTDLYHNNSTDSNVKDLL